MAVPVSTPPGQPFPRSAGSDRCHHSVLPSPWALGYRALLPLRWCLRLFPFQQPPPRSPPDPQGSPGRLPPRSAATPPSRSPRSPVRVFRRCDCLSEIPRGAPLSCLPPAGFPVPFGPAAPPSGPSARLVTRPTKPPTASSPSSDCSGLDPYPPRVLNDPRTQSFLTHFPPRFPTRTLVFSFPEAPSSSSSSSG